MRCAIYPGIGRETDKSCFTVCGGSRLSHKKLRMHPQSAYTNRKEIIKSVTTTDSIPASCKETSPFEKAVIHQAARQDSRPGGPEESRGAKHA